MAKKKKKGRAKSEYFDYNLIAAVILLTCFGLVMLYSTSAYTAQIKFDDDMSFFRKQAIISVASIIIAVGLSMFDYHLLYYVSRFIYWFFIFLMALVKYTPLGVEVNGAKRWLRLGIRSTAVPACGGGENCGHYLYSLSDYENGKGSGDQGRILEIGGLWRQDWLLQHFI